MAYIKGQADKNIDILLQDLGLNKVPQFNIFSNEEMLILSPAVQGDKKDAGGFDVNLNNVLEIKNRLPLYKNKIKLIIIRYYELFLIGSLDDFIDKLTDENYIYSPPSKPNTKKWTYNVKSENGSYFIKGKNDSSVSLIQISKNELLSYINKLKLGNKDEEGVTNNDLIVYINSFIKSKGFNYSKENIKNFYLSLRTKPFIIFSGISGTGKTKIVQLFAEAIGATEENRQFKLIPVRPDWSDSSDLLGYRDIKGEFVKGPFTEMVENALDNPDLPHFVLLDEMNLARVEYYFSDVLSVMESRKRDEKGKLTSSPLIPNFNESLKLPGNLYVIGTVNMDETTHSFSKKVLDRANTIEFNEIDLMNFDSMIERKQVDPIRVSNDVLESTYIHLIDAFKNHEPLIKKVSEKINTINKHLEPIHAQVGYRVRDEISFYMIHNAESDMMLSENEAMDFCIMQKILPRISGTQNIVEPVLGKLKDELLEYPRCSLKIAEMIERLKTDGFVSFWTA